MTATSQAGGSVETALEVLSGAAGVSVLCVGDVMLDRYVYGGVARVSPEAPVPVLKVDRTVEMPGGAGNVARNVAALGAQAVLIGAVGDDSDAAALRAALGALDGVTPILVRQAARPTTVKTRFVANAQQLLRADAEAAGPVDAACETALIDAIAAHAPKARAILVSDYAKGALAPRVLDALREAAHASGAPLIVDPKGVDFAKYGRVDLIKPNAAELAASTGLPTAQDDEIAAALEAALASNGAGAMVVTRAARGMSVKRRGGEVLHRSGEAREVYDVSGAGDTSLAALGVALAAGAPLETALDLAIAASGLVVGKAGTAAVGAAEVADALRRRAAGAGVLARDAAVDRVARWRDAGLRIGFTNGCFDILHPGHVRVLERARAACGRLVVGLNSDASVQRLKGPSRPVHDEAARATVLAALSCVDVVVVFEEDTPAELIAALQPDVLVKGGDYAEHDIVGAKEVKAAGGRVLIVPLVEGYSTTAAIKRAGEAP